MTVARRQTLLVLTAVLSVLAILVWAFRPQPVPVDLATAARGPLVVTVDGEGKTRVKEKFVVSAPLPGRVLRIAADVGDQVTAGETVLATIQPTDPNFLDIRTRAEAEAAVKVADAARALTEAELAKAMADLGFAKSELDRNRTLASSGTVSRRALELAELEVATRAAAVASARAALEMRRHELETAKARLIDPGGSDGRGQGCCVEVKAPADGRVLRVLHESEGVVEAGAPLLEIGDVGNLEMVVDLLSTDAVRVAEGAGVRIEDWGGGRMLMGRVRRVEPFGYTKVSALGIEEQLVNVLIDFTGPSEDWRPLGHGYRIEARIVTWKGDDVLKLPLSALFRAGENWAVFADRDGVAELIRVEVGHRNGTQAEILSGIEEGTRVVTHPSDRVAPGVTLIGHEAE